MSNFEKVFDAVAAVAIFTLTIIIAAVIGGLLSKLLHFVF